MSQERLARAAASLEGLSVGDGFGEQFFHISPDSAANYLNYRQLPFQAWPFTDDTNMALSIFSLLRQRGEIDQNALATSFAQRYEPQRKYGASMRGLFLKILNGIPWFEAATGLFEGQGSYGNGAAMRVAPLGAYFADDLEVAAEQARLSSEITHANIEGIAGGIAVAVAAAVAWQARNDGGRPTRQEFIERVLPYIPDSQVRAKTVHARDLPSGSSLVLAAVALGNGIQISAQDTVPFTLWAAGEHLDNYEEALWITASAGGDVDTTCAIVGGIVAAYTGVEGIPAEWRTRREPLPEWAFNE
jgi:ADP-ribosylglycohydrolase